MKQYFRTFFIVFFVYLPLQGFCQLCTGSLGDPVVNITFGTGAGTDQFFTPPAAYSYTSSSCPNDGSYTITSSTQGCFGGNWHSVAGDHTGGGAFMLVNASYTPGDFFRTTVNALCPNTTYEFASWVMNVLRSSGIAPDLTFSVEKPDGTLLGRFNTGPIPVAASATWQQYGFFFTTPPDNPAVVIRITNNAPGGNGNDLALDDITFRPCGPRVTASVRGVSGEINHCLDDQDTYLFDADPSAYFANPVFQWQVSTDSGAHWTDLPGATSADFFRNRTEAGHYWYRFAVTESGAPSLCRIYSNYLVVNIWPRPLANAGPDRVLLRGDTVVLKAQATPGDQVSWDPPDFLSDPAALQPKAYPPTANNYRLRVTSPYGCSNEDWVKILVTDGIYIPTAFTPNKDGKNDTWRIPLADPEWGLQAEIFNRDGQRLYRGEGPAIRWDGTYGGADLPSGVYVYLVRVKRTGAVLKGTITLIR